MPTIAIMIGIQGSCKSSFCREHLSAYERISLDDLHTRTKENLAVTSAFERGLDLVIDNTNPTIEDRRKYLEPAKARGYRTVGFFMQSRLAECIERNSGRTGKANIPNTAIAATSNKLQMPSREEGFDELYFVSISDGGFKIEEWRD